MEVGSWRRAAWLAAVGWMVSGAAWAQEGHAPGGEVPTVVEGGEGVVRVASASPEGIAAPTPLPPVGEPSVARAAAGGASGEVAGPAPRRAWRGASRGSRTVASPPREPAPAPPPARAPALEPLPADVAAALASAGAEPVAAPPPPADPLLAPAPAPVPAPEGAGATALSLGALGRILLGLALVAGLALALRATAASPRAPAWLAAWLRTTRVLPGRGDGLELRGLRMLNARAGVALLRVHHRTLVVGIGPERVDLLTSWEESPGAGEGLASEDVEVRWDEVEPGPIPPRGPAPSPRDGTHARRDRPPAAARPRDPMFEVADEGAQAEPKGEWTRAARKAMDEVRRARERARASAEPDPAPPSRPEAAAPPRNPAGGAPVADAPRVRRPPWIATLLLLAIPVACLAAPGWALAAGDPELSLAPVIRETVTPSLATRIVVLLTVMSLAPALLITLTCFTRLIVVFSFLRQAIGIQNTPPNQVLVGLALFLTWFIMSPVMTRVNEDALVPFQSGSIGEEEALGRAMTPVREFMFRHTRKADLELFLGLSSSTRPATRDEVPSATLIPAFIISELKTAFEIGFLIYIPFLVVDMIVATTLLAMGMMVLPPAMISLPFKLLLFVMVDGWNLTVGSLVRGFGP